VASIGDGVRDHEPGGQRNQQQLGYVPEGRQKGAMREIERRRGAGQNQTSREDYPHPSLPSHDYATFYGVAPTRRSVLGINWVTLVPAFRAAGVMRANARHGPG
jgi:hypothetical protein